MGYKTYHDMLDEDQAEAEGVCHHSWVLHFGGKTVRRCSLCRAESEMPPEDPYWAEPPVAKPFVAQMKIALDYDGTFTRDPDSWMIFIRMMRHAGHDIRIVTARDVTHDNIDDRINGAAPIIYCNGVAKRFYCHHFAHFDPHVWIDDKPEAVDGNSNFNRDMLAKWRAERDH